MTSPPTIDLLVRGGDVIDGAGNPAVRRDVAVSAGQIARVGWNESAGASDVIDASGLLVCPGFVDMHTHDDLSLLIDPAFEAKVRQGVTLSVVCQDGLGYAPLDDAYLEQAVALLEDWNGPADLNAFTWRTVAEFTAQMSRGATINSAFLAPHGTIRLAVMGMSDDAPDASQLEAMRRLVADCMRHGAAGLSTGLQYLPAMYADEDELVALCEVVARYGGYFAPHHRGYGRDALDANAECVRVAERSGAALHLTHAHLSYPINAGRAPELLAMVDTARARGVDVTLDSYPYTTGNPYLRILLPAWAVGSDEHTLRVLRDPAQREQLHQALEVEGFEGVPVDWSKIEISGVATPAAERWLGLSIQDAAKAAELTPLDFCCELLVEDGLRTKVVEHIGNEDNVQTIMRHVAQMPSSDGILAGERPHPRGWGTFPRWLGHYVRDLGVLTWEDAIRKMTSLPAQRLGLHDRGLVRPGMAADLVCLDPEAIRETGSFDAPRSYPAGVHHVVVNGVIVVRDGEFTGQTPGTLLPAHGRKGDGQ